MCPGIEEDMGWHADGDGGKPAAEDDPGQDAACTADEGQEEDPVAVAAGKSQADSSQSSRKEQIAEHVPGTTRPKCEM